MPQEDENWNPEAVWKHLRYRTTERWLDDAGASSVPTRHYNVGGNTKFWGSVLYRLRREDFQAVEHADGVSPAWPIDYDTLAPYYDRAERSTRCTASTASIRPSRRAARIRTRRCRIRAGMAPSSSSCARRACIRRRCRSACSPGENGGCILCNTCNSFPCKVHAKSEPTSAACGRRSRQPNVTLWTNACARG